MAETHATKEGCEFRLKALEDGVKEIKEDIKDLPVIEKLLEQQIASNEMQNHTLASLDKTLSDVSHTMQSISKNQDIMKVDIEGLQSNIWGLQKERTINIMEVIKANWIKLILGGYVAWDVLSNKLQ
jgi:chromosome segregation ATPase